MAVSRLALQLHLVWAVRHAYCLLAETTASTNPCSQQRSAQVVVSFEMISFKPWLR
jgi:hypothetical protein